MLFLYVEVFLIFIVQKNLPKINLEGLDFIRIL